MKTYKIVFGPTSFSCSITWKLGYFELSTVHSGGGTKTLISLSSDICRYSGCSWRDFYVWIEGAHTKITVNECLAVYAQAKKGKLLLDTVFKAGFKEGKEDMTKAFKTLLDID